MKGEGEGDGERERMGRVASDGPVSTPYDLVKRGETPVSAAEEADRS